MKIIVIGLGNFGNALALSLTETGNEVIAIDKDMEKINRLKDQISHTICMDSTNELAYNAVPLKDADKVVVAIGEFAWALEDLINRTLEGVIEIDDGGLHLLQRSVDVIRLLQFIF